MKKLALIGTVVAALALGRVGQAVAKPNPSANPPPWAGAREQGPSQRLDASTPAFGMTSAEYNALMARSEGLNKKYGLGTYSLTNTKAIGTNGRNLVDSTPTPNPIDTSTGFAWDDAGIGAGVLLAAMAFATLGVLGARHHGRLGTS